MKKNTRAKELLRKFNMADEESRWIWKNEKKKFPPAWESDLLKF